MTPKPNKGDKIFHASVITLFPELFPGVLSASLIGRGLRKGMWALDVIDLKTFAPKNPSHHIDSPPAGGGAGMVLRPDIAAAAIDAARKENDARPIIYLTPSGEPFTQAKAKAFAKQDGLIILCGRYEGVDQRVIEARAIQEISIGDFVLAGGEVAAQAMLEAVIRLLPNIISRSASLEEESFSQNFPLEYPHYTNPRTWEQRGIPEVLLSGHHQAIAEWRKQQALARTKRRRPDLLAPNRSIDKKPSTK